MTVKHEVDFATSDGVQIKGTFYDDLETDKGVVLLHGLGGSKEDWEEFAPLLREKGFKAIAIDFRGHGKSQLNWQSFTSTNFNNMLNDVRAAKDFLSANGAKKVAIIGVSIGANVALKYAGIDSEVQTVLLLSPGLDYRGVKTENTMKGMKRPVLIVVSDDDIYSHKSARKLMEVAGKSAKLEEYTKKGHGFYMFAEKKLPKLIMDWLKKNVK